MSDLLIDAASEALVRPFAVPVPWEAWKKVLFRFVFLYFIIQVLPLDWKYFRLLSQIHWFAVHFQDLFRLTTYSPAFLSGQDTPQWGLGSYVNWGIALGLAAVGSLAWGAGDRSRNDYNELYYWLRVVLRFRLSIGIAAYGIIKFFHVQIPPPSLSDLNTAYGDFLPWKIYYLTTGASGAVYEQTLGLLEIVAGALLLYRRTTVVGAGLATAILVNIVAANFAYRIGQHVYSSYLLLIALFLLIDDIPRLYSLLVARRFTLPDRFISDFTAINRKGRLLLKGLFVVFFLVLAAFTVRDSQQDRWPFPAENGLPGISGYYNVKEFRLNGNSLPYSLSDTIRWRNVVFERWNSFSIASGASIAADVARPSVSYEQDEGRDYESSGNAGRQYFSYSADVASGLVSARSRNGRKELFQFNFLRAGDSVLVLSGSNANRDSLYVRLEKTDKKYLLIEGRRIPKKI